MPKIAEGFGVSVKVVNAVGRWLADHPSGGTLEEITDAVMPGKITGPRAVTAALFMLRGQCRVRREDDTWFAAG